MSLWEASSNEAVRATRKSACNGKDAMLLLGPQVLDRKQLLVITHRYAAATLESLGTCVSRAKFFFHYWAIFREVLALN